MCDSVWLHTYTLQCYVFVCIFVYIHVCATIYGICVSVYPRVSLCVLVIMCSYIGIFMVGGWIFLAHSKCSINIFRIIYLYFNRCGTNSDLERMMSGGVGYAWQCSTGTSPSCTWTLWGLLSYFHSSQRVYTLACQVAPWASTWLSFILPWSIFPVLLL